MRFPAAATYLLRYESFGFKDGDLQLQAYSLSDINHVEKLELPAQNYHSLPEFRQGIDWQKLLREHPTMEHLWYKPEPCTFLCFRDKIEDIKMHYGDDLRIRQITNEEFEKIDVFLKGKFARESIVEVSVITDRYDAAEFARPYHFGLWVIAPKAARAIVRSISTSQLECYDWIEKLFITGKKLPPINSSYTPVNATQEGHNTTNISYS